MSQEPTPGAPTAVRGLVIVVVAALLGLFLLSRGGTNPVVTRPADTVAGAAVTSTTANVPRIPSTPSTTVAAAEEKPAGEVLVVVFNATGGAVTGAAGNAKAKLVPEGYEQVSVADAPTTIQTTAVYYDAGYEANARAIAGTLGYDQASVSPAADAQDNPGAGSGANVVVVIGTDTATG